MFAPRGVELDEHQVHVAHRFGEVLRRQHDDGRRGRFPFRIRFLTHVVHDACE